MGNTLRFGTRKEKEMGGSLQIICLMLLLVVGKATCIKNWETLIGLENFKWEGIFMKSNFPEIFSWIMVFLVGSSYS